MKLARTNAIIPLPTSADYPLAGKEGYAVALIDGYASIQDDAAGTPFGVLLEAGDVPGKASVAVLAGGLAGTVRVKLVQAVEAIGTDLQLVGSAGGCGFGPDAGAGERVVTAQALETGAIGELIEAVLFKPKYYPAA